MIDKRRRIAFIMVVFKGQFIANNTTKFVPKAVLTPPLCSGVIAVRTMPATALAAISPFEQVLSCKNPITLRAPVIISFFQGYSLIHKRLLLSGISTSKISNGFKIGMDERALSAPLVCRTEPLAEKSGD